MNFFVCILGVVDGFVDPVFPVDPHPVPQHRDRGPTGDLYRDMLAEVHGVAYGILQP